VLILWHKFEYGLSSKPFCLISNACWTIDLCLIDFAFLRGETFSFGFDRKSVSLFTLQTEFSDLFIG